MRKPNLFDSQRLRCPKCGNAEALIAEVITSARLSAVTLEGTIITDAAIIDGRADIDLDDPFHFCPATTFDGSTCGCPDCGFSDNIAAFTAAQCRRVRPRRPF